MCRSALHGTTVTCSFDDFACAGLILLYCPAFFAIVRVLVCFGLMSCGSYVWRAPFLYIPGMGFVCRRDWLIYRSSSHSFMVYALVLVSNMLLVPLGHVLDSATLKNTVLAHQQPLGMVPQWRRMTCAGSGERQPRKLA